MSKNPDHRCLEETTAVLRERNRYCSEVVLKMETTARLATIENHSLYRETITSEMDTDGKWMMCLLRLLRIL